MVDQSITSVLDPVTPGSSGLLRVDAKTYRISVHPASPSPLQRWNGVLGDLIAANPIGPTRASRAFALLNSAFYDLWAATDSAAAPVYAPASLALAPADLESALHRLAVGLLGRWFPGNSARLEQEFLAAWPAGLTAAASADPVSSAVDSALQALPALDPWASGPAPQPPVNAREISRWWPEHVPIDLPSGPTQSYLTPAWGTLPAFSTSDITQWRPPGPEPFLLVSSDVAQLSLDQALIKLPRDWTNTAGVVRHAGDYDVTDPANQQWLLGELINPAFIQQAQDVVDLQVHLSDQQKLIAEFWENGAGSAFPPGSWMAITAYVAEQQHLTLPEQIKLFFAVGQGVGDAGIAAWDAKAAYMSPRPVRAIRDLADLNLLQGDNLSLWNSYQKPGGPSSPPFPEYVSGHSTFSSAAAEVLASYLGTDAFDLSFVFPAGSSRFEPGRTPEQITTLAWSSFSEAAASAGLSRLYGGIHFADGNLDGQALGRTVGDAVLRQAASLAYADLTSVLQEPFLLSNVLEVRPDRALVLDGVAVPAGLQQIALADGDDQMQLTPDASTSAAVDGGMGQDLLSYERFTRSVHVDLNAGEAIGVALIEGFENVTGGAAADVLVGSAADNVFRGGGGDDQLVGLGGLDTALYDGSRSNYRFDRNLVIDQRPSTTSGFDGTDRLSGIEQLRFSDGTWPVAELFQPVSSRLSIEIPRSPMTIREGQPLSLTISREGDLRDPLLLQLAWQPKPEDRLSGSDLAPLVAPLQFAFPAGEPRSMLLLPTLDDAVFEGTEVGHLQISSVQSPVGQDVPLRSELSWGHQSLELVVLDNDPEPPPTRFQQLGSSPLPLRATPGRELRVPLTYSVSDQDPFLTGFAFQVHYPSPDLQFVGFQPSARAGQAASLVGAVDQLGTTDQGAVQISFASIDGRWPGQLGAGLALPLGTATFRVSNDFSADDALTGLSFSATDTATGYGFQAQAPSLQRVTNWSLDVDGDGVVRPLSDGLMVVRHLLGMQGSALTNKAISPSGTRSTAASVAEWIERGRQQGLLDLDGDGRTTALGDGLLLLRGMLGLQGESLLNKVLSPQSPLLAGNRLDQLSSDDKQWVGQLITDRIDALR